MGELVSIYLTRINKFMQSQPEGEWVLLTGITKDSERFITAIKYLIDYENKCYEFNGDYTKVRRFSNEIGPAEPVKETQSPAASEQLLPPHDEADEGES